LLIELSAERNICKREREEDRQQIVLGGFVRAGGEGRLVMVCLVWGRMWEGAGKVEETGSSGSRRRGKGMGGK